MSPICLETKQQVLHSVSFWMIQYVWAQSQVGFIKHNSKNIVVK